MKHQIRQGTKLSNVNAFMAKAQDSFFVLNSAPSAFVPLCLTYKEKPQRSCPRPVYRLPLLHVRLFAYLA